jgi:hypothetical protein
MLRPAGGDLQVQSCGERAEFLADHCSFEPDLGCGDDLFVGWGAVRPDLPGHFATLFQLLALPI